MGGAHVPGIGGADILHRRALVDTQDLPRFGHGQAVGPRRPGRHPRSRLVASFAACAEQQGAGDGEQSRRLRPGHAHRQKGRGDEAAYGQQPGAGPPVAPLQPSLLATAPNHVAEDNQGDKEQGHRAALGFVDARRVKTNRNGDRVLSRRARC